MCILFVLFVDFVAMTVVDILATMVGPLTGMLEIVRKFVPRPLFLGLCLLSVAESVNHKSNLTAGSDNHCM